MNGIGYFIAFIVGVVFGIGMILFSAVMAKTASNDNKEAK